MYHDIADILAPGETFQSVVKTLLESIKDSNFQLKSVKALCIHSQTMTFLMNHELVLKLSVSKRASQSDVAKCYNNWKQNGIPTLEVISTGSNDRFQYLITKYVEAVDGDKLRLGSQQSLNLAGELGIIAAKLHDSPPSKIKYLNHGVNNYNSWLKYNQQKLERRCNRLINNGLISGLEIQKVQNKVNGLLERNCELVELHGDLAPFNVLADANTGSVKALHDPDSLLGDPLYEVAYFIQAIKRQYKNYHNSKSIEKTNNFPEIEMFIRGYKDQSGLVFSTDQMNIINIYESCLYVNKLDYRSNYDPDNELFLIKELFRETI